MPINCILRCFRHPTVFWQDLSKIIKSGKRPGKDYLVVDVRDSDFIGGNIPNCRNVSSVTFSDKLDSLIRDTKSVPKVIFHCALSQSRWVTTSILHELCSLIVACVFQRSKGSTGRSKCQ